MSLSRVLAEISSDEEFDECLAEESETMIHDLYASVPHPSSLPPDSRTDEGTVQNDTDLCRFTPNLSLYVFHRPSNESFHLL